MVVSVENATIQLKIFVCIVVRLLLVCILLVFNLNKSGKKLEQQIADTFRSISGQSEL